MNFKQVVKETDRKLITALEESVQKNEIVWQSKNDGVQADLGNGIAVILYADDMVWQSGDIAYVIKRNFEYLHKYVRQQIIKNALKETKC